MTNTAKKEPKKAFPPMEMIDKAVGLFGYMPEAKLVLVACIRINKESISLQEIENFLSAPRYDIDAGITALHAPMDERFMKINDLQCQRINLSKDPGIVKLSQDWMWI